MPAREATTPRRHQRKRQANDERTTDGAALRQLRRNNADRRRDVRRLRTSREPGTNAVDGSRASAATTLRSQELFPQYQEAMKAKRVAIVVACLALSATATAANWVLVGDNPKATVEVDRAGITREGATTKAWFRWNYAAPQYTAGDKKAYRSAKQLNVFNCSKRQYAIAQQIGYEELDSMGDSVFHEAFRKLEYVEVIPDSIGESMLEYVCALPKKR